MTTILAINILYIGLHIVVKHIYVVSLLLSCWFCNKKNLLAKTFNFHFAFDIYIYVYIKLYVVYAYVRSKNPCTRTHIYIYLVEYFM